MNEIEKKKINDFHIKVPYIKKLKSTDILGYELFEEPYCNVALIAKKKSGKSVCLFNIIKSSVDKDTQFICFCSTHNKDSVYQEIKKYLDKLGCNQTYFNSTYDGKINELGELMEILKDDNPNDEEKKGEEEREPTIEEQIVNNLNAKAIIYGDRIVAKRKKPKKPKKLACKYFFVFDDLSNELSNPALQLLIKSNRHYKSKVVISTQYLNDVAIPTRRNLDYALIFSGINEEKLLELYKYIDVNITFEEFNKLYDDATSEKYSFFYIDTTNCIFRKRFNEQYIIKE